MHKCTTILYRNHWHSDQVKLKQKIIIAHSYTFIIRLTCIYSIQTSRKYNHMSTDIYPKKKNKKTHVN